MKNIRNLLAPLMNRAGVSGDSPAFTGTPTAPTAAAGTNTTQVATTAFSQEAAKNPTYAISNKLAADSPVTITAAQSGTLFTNTGAGGSVIFLLPASAGCTAGKTHFSFFVTEGGNDFRINVDGSDLINGWASDIGSIDSLQSIIGSTALVSADLLYIGGGVWKVQAFGTWSA